MCGLIAWVSPTGWRGSVLRQATTLVGHRGPDDEGFLTWIGHADDVPQSRIGPDSLGSLRSSMALLPNAIAACIALVHRCLSIVDLSDAATSRCGRTTVLLAAWPKQPCSRAGRGDLHCRRGHSAAIDLHNLAARGSRS